jgi:voltage-gated sodium channel
MNWCRKIVEDSRFQGFIVFVIIANAVMLGLETEDRIEQRYGHLINRLELAVLGIFVVEIILRLLAHAPNFGNFFKDPWNVFDFLVVLVSVAAEGSLGTIARLARVLRVMRLIGYSKQLRLIVDTLLRSIPSMGHVVLLLGLLVYTYAIIGITLFREPGNEENMKRWGNIGLASWSMYQTLTFENWVGLQDPLIQRYWWSPFFFLSFILVGVFVAMNLFVAVVMNNLEEVKAEQRAEPHGHDTFNQLLDQLAKMKEEITEFEATLQGLRDTMAAEGKIPAPPSP